MDDKMPQNKPDVKDLNGLAYWIGSVDATLANLTNILNNYISNEGTRWDEFRAWRDNVNQRLAKGAEHLSTQDARLGALENEQKSIREGIHEHVQEPAAHHEQVDKNESKYVSWPWIRDKIIVPIVVWGIILFIGYVVVNSISLP